MSNIKCPVCNKGTVKEFETAPYFACSNEFCPSYSETDTTEYDILIRTRKALEQSEICCTEWEKEALDYKAENIALSGDLERTRKALEIIKKEMSKETMPDFEVIHNALKGVNDE